MTRKNFEKSYFIGKADSFYLLSAMFICNQYFSIRESVSAAEIFAAIGMNAG